ncbi:hypothetical protein, partial [Aeromonas caviae]
SLAPSTQIQFMNNQSKKCLSEQHCPLGDIFDAVFVVGSYTSMCMGRDTTAHLCQASPASHSAKVS